MELAVLIADDELVSIVNNADCATPCCPFWLNRNSPLLSKKPPAKSPSRPFSSKKPWFKSLTNSLLAAPCGTTVGIGSLLKKDAAVKFPSVTFVKIPVGRKNAVDEFVDIVALR